MTFQTIGSLLAVLAVAATANAATDSATPAPSPWIIGDTAPRVGSVFEAWFDRAAASGARTLPAVTIGSPGSLQVWLRVPPETCAATEANGRRMTTAADHGLLYVCARPTTAGEARLVAAAGTPALSISGPVTVQSRWAVGATVAAILTTAVGFVGGLLTSLLQDRRQFARERRTVKQQVHETIARVLSAELLANGASLDRFLDDGADPVILQTTAYNNADALGKAVWGYLDDKQLTAYRKRIDNIYGAIPAYQRAVQGWQDAGTSDKPVRLAMVQREAERVRRQLRAM